MVFDKIVEQFTEDSGVSWRDVDPDSIADQIRGDINSGELELEESGFDTEDEIIQCYTNLARELNELKDVIELIEGSGIADIPDESELEAAYDGDVSIEEKGREIRKMCMKAQEIPHGWVKSLSGEDQISALIRGIRQFAFYREW